MSDAEQLHYYFSKLIKIQLFKNIKIYYHGYKSQIRNITITRRSGR